jgi:hypothetical protein
LCTMYTFSGGAADPRTDHLPIGLTSAMIVRRSRAEPIGCRRVKKNNPDNYQVRIRHQKLIGSTRRAWLMAKKRREMEWEKRRQETQPWWDAYFRGARCVPPGAAGAAVRGGDLEICARQRHGEIGPRYQPGTNLDAAALQSLTKSGAVVCFHHYGRCIRTAQGLSPVPASGLIASSRRTRASTSSR